MDRLPIELSIEIWLEAAHFITPRERQDVVRIALVSKAIYNVIRPALYRVLQLTKRNARHFQPDTITALSTTVLPYVQYMSFCVKGTRELHLRTPELYSAMSGVLANWNPINANVFLDASWDYVKYFAEQQPVAFRSLRGVDISYCFLQHGVRKLATDYEHARLTHVVGYVPDSSESLHDWARDIATTQPHLTHLGLKFKCDLPRQGEEAPGNLAALKAALAVFYGKLPLLRNVVVQVGGSPMAGGSLRRGRAACLNMLLDLGREDLTLWFNRNQSDPKADDLLCGRDFWTPCEGREVWTLSQVRTSVDYTDSDESVGLTVIETL